MFPKILSDFSNPSGCATVVGYQREMSFGINLDSLSGPYPHGSLLNDTKLFFLYLYGVWMYPHRDSMNMHPNYIRLGSYYRCFTEE